MKYDTREEFEYLDELTETLAENEIEKTDVVLVGSLSISLLDIVDHNDIDLILDHETRESLSNSTAAFSLSENVEVVGTGWVSELGFGDAELLNNPQYTIEVSGYKIVRPELYYSKTLHGTRKKDATKAEKIEKASGKIEGWDQELVVEPPLFYNSLPHRAMKKVYQTVNIGR